MAGTDKSQDFIFRPSPAVILCEPQLGENIGTTARAMANFGLWDLRLVNPRDGWPNEKAIAAASKADHVIDKVRVFETTEAAVADLSLVFATTARRRDLQKPVFGPEEAAQRAIAHIDTGAKAGILFGRERWGLFNEEVAISDAIVTLPVEAAFASLNIAQAVLIMAYEWRRQTDLGQKLLFTETVAEPATRDQLVGFFDQLENALDRSGFFTAPDKRPTVINNIRAMFSRGPLSAQEVRTLRGIISSLDRKHERPKPNRPAKGEGTTD
jgi:tRNA/rRNA methyltransferase